jgi:tryptophan synthase alpha subunit
VPACDRHLVFMTYLNDITDQGETEFYYQQLKVKPEKGLTLMWGVDWTFTHRGIVSPTQEKYITTGWLSFIKEKL